MVAHLHMSCTPKTRRGGAHALDLAAYRAGARFNVPAGRHEPRARRTRGHRERNDVRFIDIVVPRGRKAPGWARRRTELWTRADDAESRLDARMAREWVIAIPRELSGRQASRLAKAIARDVADRFGCIVDLSFHKGVDRHGRPQPHIHLLCTTRMIGPDGFGDKTTIERSEKWLTGHGLPSGASQITSMRNRIAGLTNDALRAAGLRRRVKHRSYASLGLDLIGSGRPKRHGRRPLITRLQLARLRRGTSGPGINDADRRRVNAAAIARDPQRFLHVLDGAGRKPTQATIREALGPLVEADTVEGLMAVLLDACLEARPVERVPTTPGGMPDADGAALNEAVKNNALADEAPANDAGAPTPAAIPMDGTGLSSNTPTRLQLGARLDDLAPADMPPAPDEVTVRDDLPMPNPSRAAHAPAAAEGVVTPNADRSHSAEPGKSGLNAGGLLAGDPVNAHPRPHAIEGLKAREPARKAPEGSRNVSESDDGVPDDSLGDDPNLDHEPEPIFDELPGQAELAERRARRDAERTRSRMEGAALLAAHRAKCESDSAELDAAVQRLSLQRSRRVAPDRRDTAPLNGVSTHAISESERHTSSSRRLLARHVTEVTERS